MEPEDERLTLETVACKIGKKVCYNWKMSSLSFDTNKSVLFLICGMAGVQRWAGLTVQAPRQSQSGGPGVPTNLVVCIDRSKSMRRHWPVVTVSSEFICVCLREHTPISHIWTQTTLVKSISKLTEHDQLAIRTFAGQRHSQSILKLTPMDKEGQVCLNLHLSHPPFIFLVVWFLIVGTTDTGNRMCAADSRAFVRTHQPVSSPVRRTGRLNRSLHTEYSWRTRVSTEEWSLPIS